MKSKWFMWSLLLICAVALVACQPATTDLQESTKPATEEPATAMTEEPTEIASEAPTEAPSSKGELNVMGVWGGPEFDGFSKSVQPFTTATGIGISFETTQDLNTVLLTRLEAGNQPDIAILPSPGFLVDLAKQGYLIPLDDVVDMDGLKTDYSQDWIDLGSYEGKLYGVWYKGALKSLVWYVPQNFEAVGYEVPTTWDDMMALSDNIVAEGGTPWCLGIESGSATGWVATDWIEDIMLRTAGPEVYDKWVNHEIPWTDPAVANAFEIFGDIALNDSYVNGGPIAVLATNFGDSIKPLVADPPGCYMHRQASFITSFLPEGTDMSKLSIFPVPPIDPQWGTPALGGGDVVVMLRDTPEARKFIQFLATPEAAEAWAKQGGFISPNRGVDPSIYPDEVTRIQAQTLANAEVFRFDGSDQMPAAVGSGAFWTQVVNYINGEDLEKVLQSIEDAAKEAYSQ